MIEPTERSIPPVMMMKVIGRATSPISATSRPWLSRLSVVRKRSVSVASTSERHDQDDGEHALVAEQRLAGAAEDAGPGVGGVATPGQIRRAWRWRRMRSARTVSRISTPCTARSQ